MQWEINLLQDYVCHTGKVSRKWKEIYTFINKCREKAKAERLKGNLPEDILIEYKQKKAGE